MPILNDLNGLTIFLTLISFSFGSIVLALTLRDFKNGWRMTIQPVFVFYLALVVADCVAARDAWCPDADQPHIRVTGILIPKYKAVFPQRHSIEYGVLACVDTCGSGAPLMQLNQYATRAWIQTGGDRAYTIVYLGRRENTEIEKEMTVGMYTVTAHPIVEFNDVATGESLYFVDTVRHWGRVLLLALSAIFCIVTLVLCSRMAATNPDTDEDGDAEPEPEPTSANEMTGLGLGAEDQQSS